MFKCSYCNNEYDSFNGLAKHSSRTHNVSGMQLYMLVHNLTEVPTCKCGCGEFLNFQNGKFGEYIRGHISRVNGGFYTDTGSTKSAATRKEKFSTGELAQWNKGKQYTDEQLVKFHAAWKDPKRRAKISKTLKGRPKSEAHRKIMRETLARNRKELLKGNPSNLEFTFADILTTLNIEFVHQYHVDGFDYDFYLPSKNLLIEIDGDYWHGNPDVYTEAVLNNMQRKNRGKDKLKTKHAADRNFKLARYWEHDINNDRLSVVRTLIDLCTS